MHPLTTDIIESFKANADVNIAAGAKAYLRNQFEFVGIKTPLRRALKMAIFKKYSFTSEADLISCAKELWELPEREYQYVAIELVAKHKKLWTITLFPFLNIWLLQKAGGIRWILFLLYSLVPISNYILNRFLFTQKDGIKQQIISGCNVVALCFRKHISLQQIRRYYQSIFFIAVIAKNFLYKRQ